MAQRDTQLDLYRGYIYIYITSVIHVVYWLGIPLINSFTSLLLVEMPVIFFISGAAYKLSYNPDREYGAFLYSKVKRVILPYYIYIAVSLIIFVGIGLISGQGAQYDILQDRDLLYSDIVNVLTFRSSKIIPFFYHIWFIVPFFIICCVAPVLRIIFTKDKKGIYLYILLCIFLLFIFDRTDILSSLPEFCQKQIKLFIVYSPFFIAGFLYKQESQRNLVCMALVALAAMIALHLMLGYSIDNQVNKSSQNLYFLFWGILSISILSLLLGRISLPRLKIVEYYNKNGYTIYLYQNITIFLIDIIVLRLCYYIGIPMYWYTKLILFIICFVSSIFINYHLSFVTCRIESFFLSKYSDLFSKTVKA